MLLYWVLVAGPCSGRGLRRSLRPHACWGCGFEYPPGAWMFVVSVVCCQVEVSTTDWSLVQKSPTDCDASFCVIKKPRKNKEAKARYWAVKTQSQWVVTAGKQTNKQTTSLECWLINCRGNKLRAYPWSSVCREELIVAELAKKLAPFYGTKTFINVFKRAHRFFPS
jgi:hypothetical protein